MLMETALEKEEMLRSAGFRYNFVRMAYINSRAKKVVGVDAVEDHSEDWIRELIAQANDSGDWRFYFDPPLSAAVKQAFLAELG